MGSRVVVLVLLSLCGGCLSVTEMQVRDPRKVEVAQPLGNVKEVSDHVRRSPEGSLVVACPGCTSGDVIVASDGRVSTAVRGLQIGDSTVTGRFERLVVSGPYKKQVSLVLRTPRDNVVEIREREPVNGPLGAFLVGLGVVPALAGVAFLAAPDRSGPEHPLNLSASVWAGGACELLASGLLVAGVSLLLRGEQVRRVYPAQEAAP